MSPKNLGIVIAPNIFKEKNEDEMVLCGFTLFMSDEYWKENSSIFLSDRKLWRNLYWNWRTKLGVWKKQKKRNRCFIFVSNFSGGSRFIAFGKGTNCEKNDNPSQKTNKETWFKKQVSYLNNSLKWNRRRIKKKKELVLGGTVKEGWMKIKNKKNWEKVWCVLKYKSLAYYKSESVCDKLHLTI